jgi:hypothetical protein
MEIDRKGTPFLFVSDEDLELIEVVPSSIDDETFKRIVDRLMDYYNEGFTNVLIDIVREVMDENPKA